MNPEPDHFFIRISCHYLCFYVLNDCFVCGTYATDVNNLIPDINFV